MEPTSTSNAQSPARTLLSGIRDEMRERRQIRADRNSLKRELGSYRKPSEIDDLLAAVDRQGDDSQAEQIRTLLAHNLSDFRRGQRLAC